jgi:hypothetical protein
VGRDANNRDVTVAVRSTDSFVNALATQTDLYPVIPNPTRGNAAVRYSLTKRGRVNVALFSVDGRLVKTLARGVQDAGQYQIMWTAPMRRVRSPSPACTTSASRPRACARRVSCR